MAGESCCFELKSRLHRRVHWPGIASLRWLRRCLGQCFSRRTTIYEGGSLCSYMPDALEEPIKRKLTVRVDARQIGLIEDESPLGGGSTPGEGIAHDSIFRIGGSITSRPENFAQIHPKHSTNPGPGHNPELLAVYRLASVATGLSG